MAVFRSTCVAANVANITAIYFILSDSFSSVALVKSQVKNILFQHDHSIVYINQIHQHSLVKKRLHKRENPTKNGQPRYK